jgi:glycosyltransferase involved in cell wall biosynthesis
MNKDHKSLSLIHDKNIKFTGKVSDELLIDYIKYASFVIVPSIYEGFGLVPLEALYLNTKPIISDIEVFKEVYSKLDVIYFKVNNHNDLASKINTSSRECNSCKDVLDKMFSSKRYMKMIEDDFDE